MRSETETIRLEAGNLMFKIRTANSKVAALLGALLAATALVALAPTAHAAVDQVCTVSENTRFSPPITNNPQTVNITVDGNLFNCTSGSASTGTYTEVLTRPNLTCTNLLLSASGTRVFNWTNSAIAPSTFTYNRTVTLVNGNAQVEFLGEIASGTFTPDPAKEEISGLEPDPTLCMTTGVSQLAHVGILTIGV